MSNEPGGSRDTGNPPRRESWIKDYKAEYEEQNSFRADIAAALEAEPDDQKAFMATAVILIRECEFLKGNLVWLIRAIDPNNPIVSKQTEDVKVYEYMIAISDIIQNLLQGLDLSPQDLSQLFGSNLQEKLMYRKKKRDASTEARIKQLQKENKKLLKTVKEWEEDFEEVLRTPADERMKQLMEANEKLRSHVKNWEELYHGVLEDYWKEVEGAGPGRPSDYDLWIREIGEDVKEKLRELKSDNKRIDFLNREIERARAETRYLQSTFDQEKGRIERLNKELGPREDRASILSRPSFKESMDKTFLPSHQPGPSQTSTPKFPKRGTDNLEKNSFSTDPKALPPSHQPGPSRQTPYEFQSPELPRGQQSPYQVNITPSIKDRMKKTIIKGFRRPDSSRQTPFQFQSPQLLGRQPPHTPSITDKVKKTFIKTFRRPGSSRQISSQFQSPEVLRGQQSTSEDGFPYLTESPISIETTPPANRISDRSMALPSIREGTGYSPEGFSFQEQSPLPLFDHSSPIDSSPITFSPLYHVMFDGSEYEIENLPDDVFLPRPPLSPSSPISPHQQSKHSFTSRFDKGENVNFQTAHKDTPRPTLARQTAHKDTPRPTLARQTAHKDTPMPISTRQTTHKDTPMPISTRQTAHKDTPMPTSTRIENLQPYATGAGQFRDSGTNVMQSAEFPPSSYVTPFISTSRYGYTDEKAPFLNLTPSRMKPGNTISKTVLLESPHRKTPLALDVDVDTKPLVQTATGEKFICEISLNLKEPATKKPKPFTPKGKTFKRDTMQPRTLFEASDGDLDETLIPRISDRTMSYENDVEGYDGRIMDKTYDQSQPRIMNTTFDVNQPPLTTLSRYRTMSNLNRISDTPRPLTALNRTMDKPGPSVMNRTITSSRLHEDDISDRDRTFDVDSPIIKPYYNKVDESLDSGSQNIQNEKYQETPKGVLRERRYDPRILFSRSHTPESDSSASPTKKTMSWEKPPDEESPIIPPSDRYYLPPSPESERFRPFSEAGAPALNRTFNKPGPSQDPFYRTRSSEHLDATFETTPSPATKVSRKRSKPVVRKRFASPDESLSPSPIIQPYHFDRRFNEKHDLPQKGETFDRTQSPIIKHDYLNQNAPIDETSQDIFNVSQPSVEYSSSPEYSFYLHPRTSTPKFPNHGDYNIENNSVSTDPESRYYRNSSKSAQSSPNDEFMFDGSYKRFESPQMYETHDEPQHRGINRSMSPSPQMNRTYEESTSPIIKRPDFMHQDYGSSPDQNSRSMSPSLPMNETYEKSPPYSVTNRPDFIHQDYGMSPDSDSKSMSPSPQMNGTDEISSSPVIKRQDLTY